MATYKQPCIHCQALVERDSRVCPRCASRTPFGYHCPNCLKTIERSNLACGGCGRELMTSCPFCGGHTFVGSERCDACQLAVMIRCENNRCQELQYFENTKCSACGKPIKKAKKQLDNMRKELR